MTMLVQNAAKSSNAMVLSAKIYSKEPNHKRRLSGISWSSDIGTFTVSVLKLEWAALLQST